MPLSQHSMPSRQNTDPSSPVRQSTRRLETMAQSSGVPQRLQNDESWIEISSQPSSSSLSSIGDEIVTTGLRVQHDSNSHRRRRMQPGAPSRTTLHRRQTASSSQEEYEESESEEDPIMTSSNERIAPATRVLNLPQPDHNSSSDEDDDDGENTTALGRRTEEPLFTPQPNAFSHPPSSQNRPSVPGSYFPSRRPSDDRNPYASRRQPFYDNYQADHDAALRASLTTLLSIGAATARAKRPQPPTAMNNEPMGFRVVPESELAGPATVPANTSRPLTPSARARSSPSIISQTDALEKNKRKASPTTPSLLKEKPRTDKKRRKTLQATSSEEEAFLSPTLITWVVSAGVLVLVSVVGFGAGYVIGREVGKGEALGGFQSASSSFSSEGGSCAKEVVRGGGSGSLARFKWGIRGGGRSVVA